MKLKIGDYVEYNIQGASIEPGTGYVIGYTHYADNIVVLADDRAEGMPINERWCTVISEGHVQKAFELRGRHQKKYPNFLKAIIEPQHEKVSR
jgi:hypothetical protein